MCMQHYGEEGMFLFLLQLNFSRLNIFEMIEICSGHG